MAKLSALVDLTHVQRLAEENYKLLNMPLCLLDAGERIMLAGAGWQDLCAQFHLVHPTTFERCNRCIAEINERIDSGDPYGAHCENGLCEIGIPILVDGQRLATLLLGQFFYEDAMPDRERFLQIAEECGFDRQAYLAALDRAPRFSRERVAAIIEYHKAFAGLISDLAEKNHSMTRELTERQRAEAELRASQSKLALTLQSIGEGLIATDAHGLITLMNPVAESLTGWPLPDALGRPVGEVFRIMNERTRQAVEHPVQKVLESGRVVGLANHTLLISRDGTERPIADSGAPIRLEGEGELLGVVLVFRDQTEERRAQAALAQSERRLRAIIDLAPFGAFEYELMPDGALVMRVANQAATNILGVDCKEFIGKTIEDAFPQLGETPIPEGYRAVAATGQPYEQQVWYQELRFQGCYETKAIQTGKNRMAVFFRDITEQKKSEEALVKRLETLTGPLGDLSDLRFEDLFDLEEVQKIQDAFSEATGVASLITSVDGAPITRPSRFCSLCNDVIRKTEKGVRNCIHSDAVLGQKNPQGPTVQPCLSGGLWDGGASICVGDRHIANWLMGQVLDDEADETEILKYAREIGADEEEFKQALKSVTRMPREKFKKVCDALFQIAKQLSLQALKNIQQAREITRRIRAEEERHKLEVQIQHAQKLESLGVLAGGIAHDFNNLLMAILGHADLALQDLSPVSPVRENLREIEKASRRAAGLCQQMLAYSGRGKFVIQVVDLGEVVEEMTHMLEVSISKKVVMRFNFAPHLPPVEADVTQLRQVIMNLIVNASEAIGDKSGVIAISTGAMECDRAYLSETWLDEAQPTGLYVYLEVADTGCGMDKATLSKIFDPFFTTKFTGRGLGLAAVLGIVRGHKGAIKVYSEPGRGTTFKILLPASRRPAKRLRSETSPAPSWKGSGTVLLVDDEETIRALGKQMLERLGFSVLLAADGREGLQVFSERRDEIHCVLLDLTMPHMDGEEAFREMRRLRHDVRVILSSGYNEQEVSQRFVGKGLAGFIQKPYQLSVLEKTLRRIFGQ